MSDEEIIRYRRSRFSARLPAGRLYSRAHYWIGEAEPGLWRVGFTKFATRMLGDLVEFGFEPQLADPVEIGQAIGSVEGFKAVTEIYSVVAGEFAGGNPELNSDITLIDTEPFGRGWLYQVRGTPDPDSVDVHGYIDILDATISKMLASQGVTDDDG